MPHEEPGKRSRRRVRRRAGASAALLALAASTAGARELVGFVAERWTTANGLPQSSVNALEQTPDGYLWIGTFGGLARFDGRRFRVYDVASEPPLPSSRITALHVDRAGALWIGTEDAGVVRLAGERVERTELPGEGLGSIWAFADTAAGDLWIGGSRGALRRRPDGRLEPYGVDEGLPSPWVRALREDAGGTLWAGTYAGVARFGPDRFVTVDAAPTWTLARGPDGLRLYGAGERGLFVLEGAGARSLEGDGPPVAARALLLDRDGALWTGGDRLGRRAGPSEPPELDAEARFGSAIKVLFADRDGGIWLGTESLGLYQLRPRRASVFGAADGMPGLSAVPVLEDRAGRLWVGTLCGGLTRFEAGRFLREPGFGAPGFDCISALAPARDGGLWVGGRGLAKRGGAPASEVTAAVGDELVRAIHEAPDGTLWIALDRGVRRFAGGRLEAVAGLEREEAFAIVEVAPGELAIGLQGAVARVSERGVERHALLEGGRTALPIRDLHLTPEGALWAASYGGGLLRIDPTGAVARVGVAQGLAESFVSRILPDGRGHLWLTGNRGVHRVSIAELEAAARGGPAVVPLSLGSRDGLEVAETNGGGQPAGWLRRDGSLVVPTVSGIAVVAADPPRRPSLRATVVVEEVRLAGRAVDPAAELKLAAGEDRRIEIRFTAPSFDQPERIRFRYRLVGVDPEWQLDRGSRTAVYTHVPAGRYRFEIEAFGDESARALSAAGFGLAVEPRFVETWQFRLAVAAGLVALAAGWHRLRLLRLRRREAELEREVAARTREIAELNRGLAERVAGQTEEIRDTRDLAVLTLARLAELRDGTTGEHLERIAHFARRLAEVVADGPYGPLPEHWIEELFRSAPLHDIGKVAIPDAILCKPGPLDEEERRHMAGHTTIGGDTLRAVVARSSRRGFLDLAAEIAYNHHERWDGRGYPRGLRGTETPLAARIVAVVDAYDAITSPRPYKDGDSHEEALRRLAADRGTHFDPVLIDAFLAHAEEFDAIRRRGASAAA